MENVNVKIEVTVSTTIFELPRVKVEVDTLFDKMEVVMKERFNEVKRFLTRRKNDEDMYGNIQYDDIVVVFKNYFYKYILNEVVKNTLSEKDKHNVVENILEFLTEKELEKAILGKPMIYAFEYYIGKLPSDGALTACLHGSTMFLLEKEFLGINNPY